MTLLTLERRTSEDVGFFQHVEIIARVVCSFCFVFLFVCLLVHLFVPITVFQSHGVTVVTPRLCWAEKVAYHANICVELSKKGKSCLPPNGLQGRKELPLQCIGAKK